MPARWVVLFLTTFLLSARPGGPAMTSTARTFHRRPLPAPGIAFSSALGRQMFAEALELKSVGCFFRLIEQFHTQQEPAFCGLGTLAMVLNALGVDPERVWKGPWRWFSESLLDCCEPLEDVKQRGITFSKVACLARCNGAQVAAHRVDEPEVTIEEFRKAVAATCQADPDDGDLQVLVVSYSRKQPGDPETSGPSRVKKELGSEEAKNAAATMVGCGQAFAQALLTEPLDGAPLAAATEAVKGCKAMGLVSMRDFCVLFDLSFDVLGVLLGAGVLRRALAFIESPLMPLTAAAPAR
ncbi:unnamed protein product [Effrenium voratum]|nr:unnamed protein product [Effrenium voratum]